MIVFCIGIIFVSGFILGGLVIGNRLTYRLNYTDKGKDKTNEQIF